MSTLKKKQVDQEEAFVEEAKGNADDLKKASASDMESVEAEQSLVAVPAEAIPVNVALPCTIYVKSGTKFLVFKRQGERVNYKTALDNQKKNTNTLYIHSAFWSLFKNSLQNMKIPENANSMAKAMHMRHLLVAYGQELEKRLNEPKKPMFLMLQKFAKEISKTIQDDPAMGGKLLRKSDDPLLYFVNHSVNSAIYSTLIALKLGLRPDEINHLTYAAIIHDVGNLFLPKRILYKRSALTPEEEFLMRQHPRKGAEFLVSIGAHGSVIQGVLHHHENVDGSGYPDKLKDRDIPIFSKIITIADVYEALTSERPYQKPIPSKDALKKMCEMKGKFDPLILTLMDTPKDAPKDPVVETPPVKE